MVPDGPPDDLSKAPNFLEIRCPDTRPFIRSSDTPDIVIATHGARFPKEASKPA